MNVDIAVADWKVWDAQSWEQSPRPGPPLLDRIPPAFVEGLDGVECLALLHSPEAYLRPDQLPPADLAWLYWFHIGGRGSGKSTAAAGWVIARILENKGEPLQHGMLIAPKEEDVWKFQWGPIVDLLPPWVRYEVIEHKNLIVFPDHNTHLHVYSAQSKECRGPNLRFAWAEELGKWPHPELWGNLRRAVRVRGKTPPRIVATANPPESLDWICKAMMHRAARVYRSRMRDNPMLDPQVVEAEYEALVGTVEGERELEGKIILGGKGVLFDPAVLDQFRVLEKPAGLRVVVAVDPSQSANRDADAVGIVAAGEIHGHLYTLESLIERMDPDTWSTKALEMADRHKAQALVVEPTGSGDYPRFTLQAQMQLRKGTRYPIVDAKAKVPKEKRAGPLSTMSAKGKLHIVGRQARLEEELTTWHPGLLKKGNSPGGLDALSHAANYLTGAYQDLGAGNVQAQTQTHKAVVRGLRLRAASRSLV